MGSFSDTFNLLLRARYPAIYIATVEEERAEEAIAAASEGRTVYPWDFVSGYDIEGVDGVMGGVCCGVGGGGGGRYGV